MGLVPENSFQISIYTIYAWNHYWKFDVHAILINSFETTTKRNPKVTHIMDYLPANSLSSKLLLRYKSIIKIPILLRASKHFSSFA